MRLLESLGYSLYASLGTADFYTEHGVKVRGGPPPSSSGPKGVSPFPHVDQVGYVRKQRSFSKALLHCFYFPSLVHVCTCV